MVKGRSIKTFEEIKEDFCQALEHLRKGEPRTQELIQKQKDGKLKINKSAIALEAGHSRTTYVNHPDINKFIEEQLEEAAKPIQVTASQVNKSLREDNTRLKLEKVLLATKLADLTRYTAKLESALGKANTKLQRLERSNQVSPNRVIGRTISDDEEKVIPFPNPNE